MNRLRGGEKARIIIVESGASRPPPPALFARSRALFRSFPDHESLFTGYISTPGGGVLGSIFAGYVPLAYPDPYPIIVYSVANYRPHVSHFWANIPQISTCRNLLTPEIPQMCDPILVTLLAPNENATPL